MKTFQELKKILTHIKDLRLIDPNIFLGPFLDVIRSEETTGPVTNLALSAINKFLSYGLIGIFKQYLIIMVKNRISFVLRSNTFSIISYCREYS